MFEWRCDRSEPYEKATAATSLERGSDSTEGRNGPGSKSGEIGGLPQSRQALVQPLEGPENFQLQGNMRYRIIPHSPYISCVLCRNNTRRLSRDKFTLRDSMEDAAMIALKRCIPKTTSSIPSYTVMYRGISQN